MGLGRVNPAPTALAGGTAAPLLVGWGCVCMEPQRPVPQNAAGGKPLLVGLPPSTPTTAPFGTNRSTQAPYSWGLGASTRGQRHWRAALRLPTLGAWMRQPRAKGTGRRHCRPAGGKSLLVGLPPSTSAIAPTETKRRAPAPCSWGGRSSARRQRHWPPALPAYSDT